MMIDYVDPIPPVLKFFKTYLSDVPVYGNEIPVGDASPVLMIKNAGGSDYTRLQLLTRAGSSSQAAQLLIRAMNTLERYAGNIQGLDVMWCQHETAPLSDTDDDTGSPESWCYMRLDNNEA